jgi:hypothetical protein
MYWIVVRKEKQGKWERFVLGMCKVKNAKDYEKEWVCNWHKLAKKIT